MQRIIPIIYFAVLLTTLFDHLPYPNHIVIIATVLFGGYQLYIFFNLVNCKTDGEIIFRQQTKPIRLIFIISALISTVGYFINGKSIILQVTLFWGIVLFDIVSSVFTNKLKPIGMLINGNYLMLNNQWKTTRDLSRLKELHLNGLTDEIKMTFTNQRKLLLKQNEYKPSDIKQLIEICLYSSKEDLIISPNLKNTSSNIVKG